jgi:hypothetical protein
MPNLATHCALSKKRTGHDFEELHKWMDAPAADLGWDHRTERHAYNVKEEKQIKEFWDKKRAGLGEKAVVEWLFHIAIDNMSTAFKKSYKVYGEKTYNYFEIGIGKSQYIYADFDTLEESSLKTHFKGGIFEKVLDWFKG